MLENIRVVLVRPSHPGNIGAVARAMKNLGLSRLIIVAPENYPSFDASARAAGAIDVLEIARVVDSLDEAIAECQWVIGSSARSRRIEWPVLDPRIGAETLLLHAQRGIAALLLGHERTGLTNEELDHCHALVHIDTNADCPSLNIAGAAHILAYEIQQAYSRLAGRPKGLPASPGHIPVDHHEMRRFYRHLDEVLTDIAFLDPKNPRLLMRRLIRFFNRAAPDQIEMNILRGILKSVQTSRKNLDSASRE
jgi:TrmH family RNA methyltransferase